jgi:hypothetical protein
VSVPPNGDTQVGVLSGNSTSFVVHQFDDQFAVGDRLLLGVYDGTVMSIPDFAFTPPGEIAIPSTTGTPFDSPTTFKVSRNSAFNSTVTLHLHGDAAAAAAGHPEYDILPAPSVTPPAAGDMTQPIWSTDVFIPTTGGTTVAMSDIQTNAMVPGIYTVWLEGHSGIPYNQDRRVPVSVRVQTDANNDGDYNDTATGDVRVSREFSLGQSILSGETASLNGTIDLPLVVSTTSAAATKWAGASPLETPVTLSWDPDSFTDCSLNAASLGMGSIGISTPTVTPAPSGPNDPPDATLTINTLGLASGCYEFVLRGTGINGDGQPVTKLQKVRFTVATTTSSGEYVDIIGFTVFEITDITANDIYGRAVSGIYADPNDMNLRRAQQPRLVPWN